LSIAWNQINFNKATWTIPGDEHKGREAQEIPLVPKALEILIRRREPAIYDWGVPEPKAYKPTLQDLQAAVGSGDTGHRDQEPPTA
jgi:hypothetical protein